MKRSAVQLQIVEGVVSEIVSDRYVTSVTIDVETVSFRTSRSGPPPISVGDSVVVIGARIEPGRTLIAVRLQRLADRQSFLPHKSSVALQLAASTLLSAHAWFGERGATIARAAVGPLASMGVSYVRVETDIMVRHAALQASRARLPAAEAAQAAPQGTEVSGAKESSSEVSIGLHGAAPTIESPWWHSDLLEYTRDAIIIWEMDGAGILYWNEAAEELYGYTREEARGKVTHDLLRTETRKPVKELESMLARYGVWVGELRHSARDGRIVEVEARLSLMSQRSGKWLVLEVNHDATDRRHAEAAGAEREVSLSSLNRAR